MSIDITSAVTAKIARHMAPINGSAIRDIFKLLSQPGMISFAGGMPSSASLEPDVVAELAREALGPNGVALLQYGGTEGWAPFVESASRWVSGVGITAEPLQILPVTGSQQSVDLICKALIDPGDTILVESPTFLGALQTMSTYQAKLAPMQTDELGVIPESMEAAILAHHPKLAYIIPTFQNPSGVTLALERRKAIAELAAKHGVLVIEDDPYRDLRFSGEPLPSIASFDEQGWVLYSGSFSKLIAPGLRVGYVVCKVPALMRKLVIGKQSTDVHTCSLAQAIVDGYLRRGLLMPHIDQIRAGYKKQLDAMLDALSGFPAGVRYTRPEGGLFVWVELPENIDAQAMLPEATGNKVAYVPGTHFYCEGGHANTMRLNFSNSPVEKIETGMNALKQVILGHCR